MKGPFKAVLIIGLGILALSACTTYERKVAPFKMPEAYPNAVSVGEAKKPKELRISLKTTDTKEVFSLTLNL